MGVGLEVLFGRMGSRRSGERSRRADERLAEATSELARIKKQRGVSAEQFMEIAQKLLPFAPLEYSASVSMEDPEQLAVADLFWLILHQAGWVAVSVEEPGRNRLYRWHDAKGRVAIGTGNGLTSGILVARDRNDKSGAAETVAEAFTAAGLEVAAWATIVGYPTIQIRIGSKI